MDGSLKNGPRKGGPKVKCENIIKRNAWVNFLKGRSAMTPNRLYADEEVSNIMNIKYSQSELRDRIVQMITEPNSTWLTLKRAKYLTPKTYFGSYA